MAKKFFNSEGMVHKIVSTDNYITVNFSRYLKQSEILRQSYQPK